MNMYNEYEEYEKEEKVCQQQKKKQLNNQFENLVIVFPVLFDTTKKKILKRKSF